jgi:hypothetical protein
LAVLLITEHTVLLVVALWLLFRGSFRVRVSPESVRCRRGNYQPPLPPPPPPPPEKPPPPKELPPPNPVPAAPDDEATGAAAEVRLLVRKAVLNAVI